MNKLSTAEQEFIDALMQRDGLSFAQALAELQMAKDAVTDGEPMEDVLDDFGLEPDYFMALV